MRAVPAKPTMGAGLDVGLLLAWLLVVSWLRPGAIIDERNHQWAIGQVLAGNLTPPHLPMVPGYHWLAALASLVFGPSLTLCRAITCLFSAGMVLLYSLIPVGPRAAAPARTPHLLVLLPILFPYSVLAYTDAAGLFFVIAAAWAWHRRRDDWAALFMACGCLIRQVNLVWLVFWAALRWLQLREQRHATPDTSSAADEQGWRYTPGGIRAYLLAAVGVGAVLLALRETAFATTGLNRPNPNICNLYMAGFLSLGLWLPLWIERLPGEWRALRQLARERPRAAILLLLGVIALIELLAATYENRHPWNWYPSFVRNLPLIAMEPPGPARVLGICTALLGLGLLVHFWWSQPNRKQLLMLSGFTSVYLLPLYLVEARYFIVPFALADLLVDYTPGQRRRLTAWYASISALMAWLLVFRHTLW